MPRLVEASLVNLSWNQQVQTDKTIPNNKLHITIRTNERGTSMLTDVAIAGDGCDQASNLEDSNILGPHDRNTEHVEHKSKSDTSKKGTC